MGTNFDSHEWPQYAGEGFLLAGPTSETPYSIHIHRWSEELEAVLKTSRATRLVVNHWEDKTHDLSFLAKFAERFVYVQCQDSTIVDRSVLSAFVNVEVLILEHSVKGIDFSQFSHLRRCSIAATKGIGNIAACSTLTELRISGARVEDIAILAPLKRLQLLSLDATPLSSLSSLEQFPILQHLQLLRCRRLDSLAGIEHSQIAKLLLYSLPGLCSIAPLTGLCTLRDLEIYTCKRIEDLERLGDLSGLELLTVRNGREIPSLTFLRHLVRLRYLGAFVTKVVDGNLDILLDLPSLEQVVIQPHMRHYSRTEEQLNALLAARRQVEKNSR